jgi:hypothetical protein
MVIESVLVSKILRSLASLSRRRRLMISLAATAAARSRFSARNNSSVRSSDSI